MKSSISFPKTTNAIFNIFQAAHGCVNSLLHLYDQAEYKAGWALVNAQTALGRRIDGVSRFLKSFSGSALQEAHLLEEGLVHIRQAPDDVQKHLRSDAANCIIELGLTAASEVALPETIAIAVAEVSEKAIHGSGERRTLGSMAKDFVLSVLSSPLAAISAGKDVIHDLEDSGTAWEVAHPPKTRTALAPQPIPVRR